MPLPSNPEWALHACCCAGLHWQTLSSVLSATPLQSLSRLELQSRVAATTAPTQAPQTPALQVLVPGLQMPTAMGPQPCTAPSLQAQPSFGVPLQLASSPGVHASAVFAAILQALQVPSAQVCFPFAQFPLAPSQARSAPSTQAQPSFATPLQVSSLPVAHASFGFAVTLQAPHFPSGPHN